MGIFKKLFAASALTFSAQAYAAAPAQVPVQGVLTTAAGEAVEGARRVRFALYENPASTRAIFEETQAVTFNRGAFVAYLGEAEDLDLALFAASDNLYLGVQIEDDQELSPRMRLGTVPYAAYAEIAREAQTLEGATLADILEQAKKGAEGPQGPAGADGAVGPQGPQGLQGPAGPVSRWAFMAVNANRTLTAQDMDNLVLASASAGALTITLPAAAAVGAGAQVTVKKVDTSANPVVVADPANTATLSLFFADDTVLMVSNGTAWYRAQTSLQRGPDGFRAAQVFGTPGNHNFVVPPGITRIRVSVWGAGGGGGAGSNTDPYAGSGGGAGGYAEGIYTVTPGASYAVIVGAGGAGAPGSNNADGTAGGESSFNGPGVTNLLRATGGGAGAQANAGGPGQGGLGQNGQVNRRGGNGEAGDGGGSGGGGSAGNLFQAGVNGPAAGSAGGIEVNLSAYSRHGGGGGTRVGWNATGQVGGFPGGGGGGAWGYTVFPAAGRGGHGAVLVEY